MPPNPQPERQPDSTEAEEWERKAIELGVGFFKLATSDPGRRAERAEHERDEAHSSAEHWHDRAEQAESQRDALQARLEELLKAVEPFTVDGGVGCGSEEIDALYETFNRLTTTSDTDHKGGDADGDAGRNQASQRQHVGGAGVDDGSGPRASTRECDGYGNLCCHMVEAMESGACCGMPDGCPGCARCTGIPAPERSKETGT